MAVGSRAKLGRRERLVMWIVRAGRCVGSAVAIALVGCGRERVIARDAQSTLTESRIVALATKTHPRDPGAFAQAVVERWVTYQSLGRAAAVRDSMTDTATVRAVLEAAVVGARLGRWLDEIGDRAIAADSGQYRARYDAGEPLAAKDVTFAPVTGDTSRRARAVAQAKAAAFRSGAARAAFEARARQAGGEYEDLGVFEKGRLVPALEAAIRATTPGHISPVVGTPYGAHVVYRPTFDEVREAVVKRDRPATIERARREYIATVDSAGRARVEAGGVAVVKAVAAEPERHRTDTIVIAHSAVRDLSAARLVWWLDVFPPDMAGQVAGAPDSIVHAFVINLVGYEVMLRSADSAGIALDAAAMGKLRSEYLGAITRAWAAMRVEPSVVAEHAGAGDAQQRVTGWRVDAYVDSLFAPRARVRYVSVPPAVDRAVQRRYPAVIDSIELGKFVERLRRDQRRADSARDAKLPASVVPIPKR